MITQINKLQDLLETTRHVDFIAPLLLRAYLAPVFYMAGISKFNSFQSTVDWFGRADGLNLPLPWLMAFLVTAVELGGSILLVFGIATRWITIPLMFTMVIAAVTVHWANGWLTIATGSGIFATERTEGAIRRLSQARSILREHGNYSWLTENGSFVVLNNGIEFAATYFIMLLALLYLGGGRYVSVDYWIARKFRR